MLTVRKRSNNSLLKNIRALKFRKPGHLRKYCNNENFPIYGILKCVIIILHFMTIKLCVIKTVRSINDNILYIYLYVIHNKHPYILISKMMYFKHYLAILYSMSQIKIH